MPDVPTSKFSRYRSKKRDELSDLHKEVARLQEEVDKRDQRIEELLCDRQSCHELQKQIDTLTKLTVLLAEQKKEAEDRLRWNRSDVERWYSERIITLEHRIDDLMGLVIPKKIALYGRARLHSDREYREASKPFADELFKYLTRHSEMSED